MGSSLTVRVWVQLKEKEIKREKQCWTWDMKSICRICGVQHRALMTITAPLRSSLKEREIHVQVCVCAHAFKIYLTKSGRTFLGE